MYKNSYALAFISQIKGILCVLIPEGSSFHLCETTSGAQPSISSLSGGTQVFGFKREISFSEEKALSEVAEPQQSQSCFCKLQHVPAMSNNSRYVYRKDTFRLISWEISLNTFSLLHHAEEHQSSREIYYILLEK